MSERRVVDTADGALTWRKSSYSGSGGGNCVEVATEADNVYIRDSKDAHSPVLTVSSRQWTAFLARSAQQER